MAALNCRVHCCIQIQENCLQHLARGAMVQVSHVCETKNLILLKNYMMNKYGYDFRIQSAEIYNEDIQCLKQ